MKSCVFSIVLCFAALAAFGSDSRIEVHRRTLGGSGGGHLRL